MTLLYAILMAFIGGALGASLGALGGFVLFGFLGTIAYLTLLLRSDSLWLEVLFSTSLFLPSVCFVGGAIATAFARKRGFIECGKDIGRSMLGFHSITLMIVGGVAGLIGYGVHRLYSSFMPDMIDAVAITVLVVPLAFKYLWRLTKTNDCEGSSHALPSPYRFFERLAKPQGQLVLAMILALVTAIVTLALLGAEHTIPHAGMMMFFLSALSLYLLYFNIPIPVSHHITGPAGLIVVHWFHSKGNHLLQHEVLIALLWAVAIAMISLLGAALTKRYLFDEGDIHIDPPAGGIVFATTISHLLFPTLRLFSMSNQLQIITAILFAIAAAYGSFYVSSLPVYTKKES